MLHILKWLCDKLMEAELSQTIVTERKRSEAALIQVVQEAFINGVSTRKIEKLANSLGISGISKSQVSEMTKGLNDQVSEFRNRKITMRYPIL